jgi:hemerythrin-like domain-containing protein
MNEVNNIINTMTKISKEHKIITDYVSLFNTKLKEKDREFFEGLNAFIGFLKKDLLKHFHMEELIFFPAAILGERAYDTTLMVMNLQKDHGILENQLKSLIDDIKDRKLNPENIEDELMEKIKGFFDALKIHAKREFIELYPMINENPRSKALMKSYFEEIKNHQRGEPV